MKRDIYDKQLINWAQNHHWDSLEKDRDLILRHLRTFAGGISQLANSADGDKIPVLENTDYDLEYVDAYTVRLHRC